MTGDLVERLRAALDRAEEIADAAIRPPSPPWASARLWRQRPENAAFMAANGPDVVLRSVAAHRKILDRHAPRETSDGAACTACLVTWHYEIDNEPWPCSDVRALASIYFPEGTE